MGSPFFAASPLELPSAALGCGFSPGTRFPQPGDTTCCGLTNTKLLKGAVNRLRVQEKSKKYSRQLKGCAWKELLARKPILALQHRAVEEEGALWGSPSSADCPKCKHRVTKCPRNHGSHPIPLLLGCVTDKKSPGWLLEAGMALQAQSGASSGDREGSAVPPC